MMGYGDKKKVITEKSKPKVNKVLESVKEEFGYVNEGPAYEYKGHIQKIDKLYDAYWDSVKDFEKLLVKKGLKKEAHNLHSFYTKFVVRFHQFFVKFIRKLM